MNWKLIPGYAVAIGLLVFIYEIVLLVCILLAPAQWIIERSARMEGARPRRIWCVLFHQRWWLKQHWPHTYIECRICNERYYL